MSEATERPWRVVKWIGVHFIVAGDNDAAIAKVDGSERDGRVDNAANAHLIVRAVNAHEDFIAGAKEVLTKGHHYSCNFDLGPNRDCNCGLDKLAGALSRLDAGGRP